MNKNYLKTLKKALLNITLSEVSTDKGLISVEGEKPEVGAEVTITNEEGEEVPAEDGEYITEDIKFIVKDGKIESIEDIEKIEEVPAEEIEETPAEEQIEETPEEEIEEAPAVDEKDAKIAELEEALAAKDAEIEALKLEIEELKNKADAPVEEPIDLKPTVAENLSKPAKGLTYPESGALKYFK